MKRKRAAVAALAGAGTMGIYKLYSHTQRPRPLGKGYSEAPKKVLIVGGGFGGLAALEGLVRALGGSDEVGVAPLDWENYTTLWPMAPAAISADVEVRHMAHSI